MPSRKYDPEARGVLLIPENHTRNLYYLENVAQIALILKQAGLMVRIGSLLPDITRPTPIALPGGNNLMLEPLQRKGNRLTLENFDPCVVLLNNDLSAGVPDILQNLEQTVLPPLEAGWATRRKSRHLAASRGPYEASAHGENVTARALSGGGCRLHPPARERAPE